MRSRGHIGGASTFLLRGSLYGAGQRFCCTDGAMVSIRQVRTISSFKKLHPDPPVDHDEHLMLEALKAMRQGFDHAAGFRPFGAVVAKDGVVIGKGINTCVLQCDPTAHAEVNAIRKAALQLVSTDLSGCILYASAQPCPMCRAAAFHAGTETVIYASMWSDYQDLFPDQACYNTVTLNPDPSLRLSKIHRRDTIKLWNDYRDQGANNHKEDSNS